MNDWNGSPRVAWWIVGILSSLLVGGALWFVNDIRAEIKIIQAIHDQLRVDITDTKAQVRSLHEQVREMQVDLKRLLLRPSPHRGGGESGGG